jgi:hypothetical protein
MWASARRWSIVLFLAGSPGHVETSVLSDAREFVESGLAVEEGP